MNSQDKNKVIPWLAILLVVAIIFAIVSFVGKGNESLKLSDVTKQLNEYKKTAEEEKNKAIEVANLKVNELTKLVETNKEAAKTELEDSLKKYEEESLKKFEEEKATVILEKDGLIAKLETEKAEIVKQSETKLSELSAELETAQKSVSELIGGLNLELKSVFDKYSNDYTARAKDVINAIKEKLSPFGINIE